MTEETEKAPDSNVPLLDRERAPSTEGLASIARGQLIRPIERAMEVLMYDQSPDIDALVGALAAAQGKFGPIERTLRAEIKSAKANYTYEYAPLDEVLAAVRPALSENGLAIMQFPQSRASSVVVRTRLYHKSGQWISNDLAASSEGTDPRSIGSAITYLRRYSLMPMLGIAPAYDDDGAAASQGAPAGPPQPAQRKSQQAVPTPQTPAQPPQQPSEAPAKKANVGVIEKLKVDGNAARAALDTGFAFGTRNAEHIAALQSLEKQKARIEVVVKPAASPGHLPMLEEILILTEAG